MEKSLKFHKIFLSKLLVLAMTVLSVAGASASPSPSLLSQTEEKNPLNFDVERAHASPKKKNQNLGTLISPKKKKKRKRKTFKLSGGGALLKKERKERTRRDSLQIIDINTDVASDLANNSDETNISFQQVNNGIEIITASQKSQRKNLSILQKSVIFGTIIFAVNLSWTAFSQKKIEKIEEKIEVLKKIPAILESAGLSVENPASQSWISLVILFLILAASFFCGMFIIRIKRRKKR